MIVVMMLLSLFIPFVAKAIHDSSETKSLRKIVNAITVRSQGVQSEAKKNILQRLLRSIKCIPEPKLPVSSINMFIPTTELPKHSNNKRFIKNFKHPGG
ncbi:hypothetical protein RR48_00534 [Papilio machaon]|uniref:Secreted protein n=1 Tax=Papilio machaon TaxID=76193 RepID=A0A0N1PJV4_PAPMA|nr:hypothetical protein RR48_00534 [Papilio machaon]